MRIEKLDPGAALAYQAYLDRAGDPNRPCCDTLPSLSASRPRRAR
jgi:hypothetical protein